MNLKKLLHLAGAGGLVLGMSLFGTSAMAREAQAVPGTFRSAIVVANPGAVEADVTLNFVKPDGTTALAPAMAFKVAAGASSQVYVPSVPGLADGRYSVVIDSNQNVVAIANLTSDNPSTSTSYNGISQNDVGKQFNMPSVYKNYFGYTSSLVIQNAAGAVANATITYKRSGSPDVTETRPIPGNASVTVDQGAAALADGFIGSAVVTSDQDVAAIFLVSGPSQLSSGRGAKSGAPIAYAPVIYDQYFGYVTNVFVQNLDTTATNVTIEYFDSRTGASVGSEQATIQPGASTTFFQFDTGRGPAVPRPGFNGSAVVRSTDNKNIIAVANINNPRQGYLEAYNGFASSGATQRTSCPAIMKNYHNYNTSLTVQNVGTAATNLTIQYVGPGGQVASSVTIGGLQPNATAFRYSPALTENLPDGFLGSAVVASSGEPIVAVVNELFGTGSEAGDQLFTYACSNS
jgi:hypothetical protein